LLIADCFEGGLGHQASQPPILNWQSSKSAIIKIGNHQIRIQQNQPSAFSIQHSAFSNQQSAINNQHFLRRPENRQSSNPHSANQHSAINNQQSTISNS
jgi:hypothetical protein